MRFRGSFVPVLVLPALVALLLPAQRADAAGNAPTTTARGGGRALPSSDPGAKRRIRRTHRPGGRVGDTATDPKSGEPDQWASLPARTLLDHL